MKTAIHLGNELSEDGKMDIDNRQKKEAFVTRSLEVREQFSFAHPMEILQAGQHHGQGCSQESSDGDEGLLPFYGE